MLLCVPPAINRAQEQAMRLTVPGEGEIVALRRSGTRCGWPWLTWRGSSSAILNTTSPTVAVVDGFAAQFYVDFGRRLQKAARLNGNGLDPRLEDAINSLEHAATEWARRGGHKPATPEVPSTWLDFAAPRRQPGT